mgnify:CR=1 FL=1
MDIPQKVGFRRFAIDNGIMTINGKRIVFKGVDRHEFSGRFGRVPNYDEMLQDIITMKQTSGSPCLKYHCSVYHDKSLHSGQALYHPTHETFATLRE